MIGIILYWELKEHNTHTHIHTYTKAQYVRLKQNILNQYTMFFIILIISFLYKNKISLILQVCMYIYIYTCIFTSILPFHYYTIS